MIFRRILQRTLPLCCLALAPTEISTSAVAENDNWRPSYPIVLSSNVPTDMESGAPNAGLWEASYFAWNEFIALNWPALQQDGRVIRGRPDPNALFGGSGPLVWETYRHKVEIFPGSNSAGMPPHGFGSRSPVSNDPYDYTDPPQYQYLPSIFPAQGQVQACRGQSPVQQPAYINLDETSQIGLDYMYAGVLDGVLPSPSNSAPTQIRYLAKANQVEYDYAVGQQLWYSGPGTPLQSKIDTFSASLKNGRPANPASIASLPAGTIEVKSAWRPLASGEDPSRFHMNTVRYYEPGPDGKPCYWEGRWALIALHIIQKTPSAPYFVFATFEQADNVLTPDGQPVEGPQGVVIPVPGGSTLPTEPNLAFHDDPNYPNVAPQTDTYCQNSGSTDKRLYYKEIPAVSPIIPGTVVGGNICVNLRNQPTLPLVASANQAFQLAMRAYASSHGVAPSPFQYYRLVSVQPLPFNSSDIVGPQWVNSPQQASNYYQANIVVETDPTLQQFKGRIANDQAPTAYPPGATTPNFQNVVVPNGNVFATYQMGGCMGCHGNAEVGGTDFSFILGGNSFSTEPDTPSPDNIAAKQNLILQRFFNRPRK